MAAKAATKSAAKTVTKTTTKTTTAKAPAKATPKTVMTPDPVPTPAATTPTGNATLGFLDVPTLERSPWGILALVFNIIPGGVGTIIAGAKVSNTGQIIKGVLQLVIPVLGWVWSIVDGIRMFTRSA
jgi:hypothetical protein